MNKKQWKAEYGHYRALRSSSCYARNNLKSDKASIDIFNIIKRNAHKSVYSAIYDRWDMSLWSAIKSNDGYSPKINMRCNLRLPANHRGHLA